MSKRIIIPSIVIAVLYLALLLFLINHSLVAATVGGNYPLIYKVTLLVSLFGGLGATMSELGVVSVLLIALLTGLNLSLSVQRLRKTKKSGAKLAFFPGAIFGMIGAGCGACGLPAVSFVGLGGSLVYLPFKGRELSMLAILLLLVSLFYLLKSSRIKSCKLPS